MVPKLRAEIFYAPASKNRWFGWAIFGLANGAITSFVGGLEQFKFYTNLKFEMNLLDFPTKFKTFRSKRMDNIFKKIELNSTTKK